MPGIPSKPNNIPLASSLPKVSFRKVSPDEALISQIPPGIIEPQLLPFGYNDATDYSKPDYYIRYLEPIEAELKKQVEYDMDEQDQEWLDAFNQDRRNQGLDSISYEVFEVILDQLEKEWFDLMKRIPPKVRHETPADAAGDGADADQANSEDGEDSRCAICDDGECENSNAIVFCDGCNLAVHQDCYGIPYIPEGQWLCRKCTVSPDRAVSCILCPHEGGAFKQTTMGKWAHLLCAMWIPETGVSNPVYMEPIDSVERIPKARWKLQCYLCRYRMGACIQCDNRSCFTAFHVTCARKAGLLFRTERTRAAHHTDQDSDSSDYEGNETLQACCHRHMPLDMRDQFKIDFGRQDDERFETSYRASPLVPSRTRELSVESGFGAPLISVSRRSSIVGSHDGASRSADPKNNSKSARAYKKSYKSGPPLIPAYIANRVLEYITKIHLRKKASALQLIARYWSLKHESRRGAPLLKRLHLEPWTTSTQNKEQTDAQKGKKLLFLRSIRADLERVRMLVEQVRKREKEKLRQAQEIRTSLVEPVLFPFHADLRAALARFEAVDKYGYFALPVSAVDVPDYYDIIQEPMDWLTIKNKIADKVYESVDEMRKDVLKIATNSMTYNKPDTPYHKDASRVLKMIPEVFRELEAIEKTHLHRHEHTMTKQLQQQLQAVSVDSSDQYAVSTSQTNTASYSVDAQVRRRLLELGMEPPSDIVSLLRDYHLLEESEQMEIRQQAYGTQYMPSNTPIKSEEGAAGPSKQRHAMPVTNLIEDFVREVYIPLPPPAPLALASPVLTSKKQNAAKVTAATDLTEAVPPKVVRKRKASNAELPAPGERRSTRRSIALEPEAGKASKPTVEASLTKPARNKRLRSQSSAKSSPTENAGLPSGKKQGGTPMTKSVSQTSAEAPVVQVQGDVDPHDSFLRFNTGWVLPEGSKRHRNAAARPEMIGQRPRKISAPDSPAPIELSQIAEQIAASAVKPQQRPRSRTTPSSSRHTGSAAEARNSKLRSNTRRASNVESGVKDKQDVETAASSPLTSDDEGEQTASTSAQAKRTRSTSTREQLSEGSSEPVKIETSAAIGRGNRNRTASAGRSVTPAAMTRRQSASTVSTDFAAIPPTAGTRVWAKLGTYPHFPGVVVSDKSVFPREMLKTEPENEGWVAIKFFGKKTSWGWVATDKLAPLLVDAKVDQKYLKLATEKAQTKLVKEAYDDAKLQT